MKKEKPIKKAYYVTPTWSDYPDSPFIIYAESAGKAKYLANQYQEFQDDDWFRAKAKRAYDYDLYEPKHHELVKELNKKEISTIAHMNGNSAGVSRAGYRNYYCAGIEELEDFENMEKLGIVTEPVCNKMIGENARYIYLTDLGKQVALSLLPSMKTNDKTVLKFEDLIN